MDTVHEVRRFVQSELVDHFTAGCNLIVQYCKLRCSRRELCVSPIPVYERLFAG